MRSRAKVRAGVSLVELMVVVAIVGVLATIAQFAYSRYVRKGRVMNEVIPLFSELKAKEESFASENGAYLATGAFWPTPINGQPTVIPTATFPVPWQQLRIQPGKTALYCQYQAFAGTAGQAPPEAIGLTMYATELAANAGVLPTNWFYLVARCDMDNDAALSTYATRHDLMEMVTYSEGE
ncbi:MAG: prepilin-type N-terminal cleavage/methylation domain-containing protein [Pseudomonadota bacterium]